MSRSALLTLLGLALFVTAIPGQESAEPDATRWYKGNTHTHTLNSDGDSTPDEVVRWYREQGYDFLVLTDHNFLTSVDGLNALYGADEQFLVIPGEEVTSPYAAKPVHINGLDVKHLVEAQDGATVVEAIQRNVDAIREADGVPHINHPNFRWAITTDELAQVRNNRLLEIYNGHPDVNNTGGGGVPGLEEIWDDILSRGILLYGIAVDDAHVFKQPWNRNVPRPGQGWVSVKAERLAADAIMAALERGDFYASTGVELREYEVSDRAMRLAVAPRGDTKYRVQFIGEGGRLLKEVATPDARYDFSGSEAYVRAKVIDSNGRLAWTQPVMGPAG